MKRCGLDFVTLGTVLVTAFTITKAGWFAPARSATPRQTEVQGQVSAHDPYTTDAAFRYRRGQANHWRACILQH